MKRETEATLIAAQDQAITSNSVKVKIHKQQAKSAPAPGVQGRGIGRTRAQ